jgi:hypothetical protein
MRMTDLKQPVNKRMLFLSLFLVLVMVGSLALRELYPNSPLFQKLFGGLNILIFWVIAVLLLYILDRWLWGNKTSGSEPSPRKGGILLSKTVGIFTLAYLILFCGSLKLFYGHAFLLFWVVFISLLWIVATFVEYRRKKRKVK